MAKFVVALCVLLAAPMLVLAQDSKPPRKFTFGLFGGAMREDLTLYQGGARNEAGEIVIKENDRLLKWAGKELASLDDFCRALYATKPGDVVEVEISRPAEGDKRETLTVKIKLGDPKAAYKELYTHFDKRKRTYDWRKNKAVTQGGPLRQKLWPQIQKHKLETEWDNLTAAHARELDLWDSYENLSSTDLLLSDPLASHQWIEGLGRGMDRVGKIREWQVRPVQQLLDRETQIGERGGPELPAPPGNKADAAAWWTSLADTTLGAADPLSKASESQSWGDTCRQIREFEFHWRGQEGFAQSAAVVAAMRELGFDAANALQDLTWLLDYCQRVAHGFWNSVKKGEVAGTPDGLDMSTIVEGESVCFRSSYGLIAIGGENRNVWKGGPNAPAVILDLGGDDEYIDCAYTDGTRRVSIVIDLAGNDRYRSTGKWGVGCGMLGIAVIDDHAGDDIYECGDWGIGAAFGGIGLVVDRAGNDRFLGGTNSIGCAAYGIGGVIDLEGNDIYDAHIYSIGCGQPGGVGFVLDHAGDDRYRCTGKQPSAYGTQGEWMGGGIGCGFGWRTLACGGVGLVIDVKGNDIYDAGEFGLACGYFMAVGAVRDMDGDDIYHSSRYGLAAAAHAAVGVFMDDKGHDVYIGKTAASIGGTWDIVTGYFYDGTGNDVYRCDGLGLGACAQNGFGIFWDNGGDDVYQAGGSSLGFGGAAEYAGGRLAKNFGIFIDSGGTDSYPGKEDRNKTQVLATKYGLFWDE